MRFAPRSSGQSASAFKTKFTSNYSAGLRRVAFLKKAPQKTFQIHPPFVLIALRGDQNKGRVQK